MAATPPSHFERLADLFERALQIQTATELEGHIQAGCAGDTALERDLRRLLKSDSQVRSRTAVEQPLPRFGVYQARSLIGMGGMGAVYRATREDGEVRQEVAVKVVGAVLWTAGAEDRFRRERQILAELQHPNIARFLDGGVTENGSPFLVMEFIEGEAIDRWCDQARAPIRKRLELFLKVCEAVGFAHSKLIVHRDLKPANILVTREGEPKLLDFGIARTLDAQTLDGAAAPTATLAFTPQYASPEQLRGEASGVSCDVYSLGVVLFELLSGARPFGTVASTPAQAIASALSMEARLPSESAPETGAHETRSEDSASALKRHLRGDLDAIVAKAMAKSVAVRYASVEQLGADVRRYLDGFPVLAAPTGAAYRVRKFVSRHKAGVAAGALLVSSIGGGLGATLWQARRARTEQAAAERRFDVARGLARYLVFDLQSKLERLPSSTAVRADIVQQSMAYLDRLAAEKIDDDALRVEVGHAYWTLADVLGAPWRPNIGQLAKAREAYRKAIGILEPVVRRDPNSRAARLYLSRSKASLGRSLSYTGSSDEGRKLLEEGARESAELGRLWPEDLEVRANAGAVWYGWALSQATGAGFFVTAKDGAVALDAARRAVENLQAALRLKPGDLESVRILSNTYTLMGYITGASDVPGATHFFRDAVAVLDQTSESDRQSAIGRQTRGNALLALGANLGKTGAFPEAVATVSEARQIRDRLSQEDPNDRGALVERYQPYNYLGDIEANQGKQTAALSDYLTALEIVEQVISKSPNNRNFQLMRADVQAKAARVAAKVGRQAEAEGMGTAALTFYRSAAVRPDASHVEMTLAAQELMETPVTRLRDPKAALGLMQQAAGKAADDAFVQEELAQAYWLNGDRNHAVEAIQRALALGPSSDTPDRRELLQKLKKYQTDSLR